MYVCMVGEKGPGEVLEFDFSCSLQKTWFEKRFSVDHSQSLKPLIANNCMVFPHNRHEIVVCSEDLLALSAEVEYLITL